MKHPLHLLLRLVSPMALLALGCGGMPTVPPPAGGQSGDDGDATPPPPPGPPGVPPGPAVPQLPCEQQEAELAPDEETAFGASSQELVSRLAASGNRPFFWVPYDGVPGTSFTPGPGAVTLTLGLDLNEGLIEQTRWRPLASESTCPDDTLLVPVVVNLQTSDGALNEHSNGWLQFTSGRTAHLSTELPAELGGSFAFEQIGAGGEDWRAEGFDLEADLWPGGSRGALSPRIARSDVPPSPGSPAAPPPNTSQPSEGSAIGPDIPSHWPSIAVWPRRESCDGERRGRSAVHADEDPVIGLSITDVVNDLNARSEWTLTADEQATPVRFTLDVPMGLQCVRQSGRAMSFEVVATLQSQGGAGSSLEHLSAINVFELAAKATSNGSALEELYWVRRDVDSPETRGAFEATTGLLLNAPEQYQEVWWSWHGRDTRPSADAPWTTYGEFVVSSLNADQTAEMARVTALGGPGVGISFDALSQFPELPGDALLEAESAR
jgi:hypothetical protein